MKCFVPDTPSICNHTWSHVEFFSEIVHIRWLWSIWKSPITAHSLYLVMSLSDHHQPDDEHCLVQIFILNSHVSYRIKILSTELIQFILNWLFTFQQYFRSSATMSASKIKELLTQLWDHLTSNKDIQQLYLWHSVTSMAGLLVNLTEALNCETGTAQDTSVLIIHPNCQVIAFKISPFLLVLWQI